MKEIMRTWIRRLGMVFAFALLLVLPATTQVATRGAGILSGHDRDLLAEARTQGKSTVMMMIAAVPGATSSVITGIQKLGGAIRFRDDDLSYVRAIVPIQRAEAAAGLSGIEAIDFDELVALDDPILEGGDGTAAIPPPGPDTLPMNPYMPTQDIGAPQFVQENPTFDGRGVKIAIVDTGIDLLTPELQTAKLSDGTPARKIVDWVNFNDPLSGQDPSWVDMQAQVTVTGGSFTANGKLYTGVPADGQYRFGVFREASISSSSEYGVSCGAGKRCADLNRNGVFNEEFAVLWRTSDNTAWVDSNADRNFAGEPGMQDYRIKYDMGLFGTDNPVTPVRESVPFVVQTDGKDKFVNIGVVGAAHATHVAGIAAGNGFFGGAFNGVAPEAQLVSVRVCLFGSSCTAQGMLEGMIYAAKQANVDVINMSIGGLPALNDGNTARDLLYNRLIEQTKAQMFFSAGNSGPGVNTVGDPSVATLVMSVGASVTKDTWYYDFGVNAVKIDDLFSFSSRGPREDGGFKPNIVAPGCAISSLPAWQPGQPIANTYPLPPGYGLYSGTSMASPMATGGAALLISAANQLGVQHKPDQLRQAINSSARFLPAFGAHEQGNGLLQVGAAWDLLRTNIQTAEITSVAPVYTVLSNLLAVPDMGPGIHEREGWKAGDLRVLNIVFTRTKGPSKPVLYDLSWVGNDGTFSSAATISLPRNVAVALPVTVHPTTPGVHSANLNLLNQGGTGFDYQVMNTVVAAEQFTLSNGYSVLSSGGADRPGTASFFFNVPPGVPFLNVELTPLTGRSRVWAVTPYGVPYGYTAYFTGPGPTVSLPIPAPMAGVWEFTMETYIASPVTPATFSLNISLLDGSVTPSSWTIESAVLGTPYFNSFTFTNNMAAFNGGGSGSVLAAAYKTRPTISMGQVQYFDITVPAGSASVYARTGNPSDPLADIDLYLYDCGTGSCVLRAYSAKTGSDEYVSYSNPKAGAWRVAVVTYSIPSGSTAYDYTDAIGDPKYGFVSLLDPFALRNTGATWSSVATVTALTAPPAGRFLQGFVYLRASPNLTLASAEVNLKF